MDRKIAKYYFLKITSFVYLIAFTSLYIQIPGLYGENGILPAKSVLDKEPSSVSEFFNSQATLLRFSRRIGLNCELGMELLCIFGMILSFFMIISRTIWDMASFALLWILYYSLYQVGQTFLHFQWDILLLEAGFLAILVAPMRVNLFVWHSPIYSPHDGISMWLVKWLFFRLMFASGVVKLTSGCPTWWGLTALDWHYESQCIPTPLAWYFHQLPKWFQAWSVVATYVIEIACPLLFVVPISNIRLFSFGSQILLQGLIILTGNYNFFNLLTIGLSLSLVCDEDFSRRKVKRTRLRKIIMYSVSALLYGLLIHNTIKLFDFHFTQEGTLHSKIKFSKSDFDKFLSWIVPFTTYIAAADLVWQVVKAFYQSFRSKGMSRKLWHITGTLFMAFFACVIFLMSLVPYTYIERETHSNLPVSVRSLYTRFEKFEIVNSYGLFRRMTGVGGRPEVILEGSHTLTGPWKEYEFLYKPGSLSRSPPVVAPHQPRLDWQMWFAALGSYTHNPWFINLVYRLLNNEPTVVQLIEHNPFPKSPPTYIRAKLYNYHYTKSSRRPNWWTRDYDKEYLPPVSATDSSLLKYLREQGIIGKKREAPPHNGLAALLTIIRSYVGQPEGFSFVSGIISCAALISTVHGRLLRSLEWQPSLSK